MLPERLVAASQSMLVATARWGLFFAVSFALTAGMLILAHV